MDEINAMMGEALYHVLFHYNNNRELWFAIPREQYVDYWNGTCSECLAHANLEELMMLVLEKYLEE